MDKLDERMGTGSVGGALGSADAAIPNVRGAELDVVVKTCASKCSSRLTEIAVGNVEHGDDRSRREFERISKHDQGHGIDSVPGPSELNADHIVLTMLSHSGDIERTCSADCIDMQMNELPTLQRIMNCCAVLNCMHGTLRPSPTFGIVAGPVGYGSDTEGMKGTGHNGVEHGEEQFWRGCDVRRLNDCEDACKISTAGWRHDLSDGCAEREPNAVIDREAEASL